MNSMGADSYIVAAGTFIVNLIAMVVTIYKLGRAVERFENIGIQQAKEINELKTEVSTVARLVTETSLQSQRLEMMEERVGRQDKLIDDMRRGEGFIVPLNISAYEMPKRPGT